MRASAWSDRRTSPAASRPDSDSSGARRRWIGLDFSGANDPRRAKSLVPLLLLAAITALGVAALRIDLIRTRYAVAAATEAESTLIEERRALTARKRQLRDPMVLAVEARKRGFRPPAHIFSLPDPSALPVVPPHVAAGPSEDDSR